VVVEDDEGLAGLESVEAGEDDLVPPAVRQRPDVELMRPAVRAGAGESEGAGAGLSASSGMRAPEGLGSGECGGCGLFLLQIQ
jgi:hypothetical protein